LEIVARCLLTLVGVFLLCVGVHEVLYAVDLTVRLAGWGLIIGGLSGLLALPTIAPSSGKAIGAGRPGWPVLRILPALCGVIGMMTGAYLVAAIHTPPGGAPDLAWLGWLALAVLSGASAAIVLWRGREVFTQTPERPGLAIGSALTALASIVGVAQFARDTVYEPSRGGASVALHQELTASRMEDGRVRLELNLSARNVGDRRVAVVGSLCTVRGEKLVRTPRLTTDQRLLRRAAGGRQSFVGVSASEVTQGTQHGRGAVLHSMRPTSAGLYLEPEEPWSQSRVVVVPDGDYHSYRWQCQLSVAKGDRLLRQDAETKWHEAFGGVASASVLQHVIGLTWRITTAEQRLRVSERSLLRRWAEGRFFIAWRRSVSAETDPYQDPPSGDELMVYLDRIGRARSTALLDDYNEYLRDRFGLVVAEGIVEVPVPRPIAEAKQVAPNTEPPTFAPVRDPARLARDLRKARMTTTDARELAVVDFHGRRFAVTIFHRPERPILGRDLQAALRAFGPVGGDPDALRAAVPDHTEVANYKELVRTAPPERLGLTSGVHAVVFRPLFEDEVTVFRRRGETWAWLRPGVCTPTDYLKVPIAVWRAWRFYDEATGGCHEPVPPDRVSDEQLKRARSWMPKQPESIDHDLASASGTARRLYAYRDPRGKLLYDPMERDAAQRLHDEGFRGGLFQRFSLCDDYSSSEDCRSKLENAWRYVLVLRDEKAALDEVEAVEEELLAGEIGEAVSFGDVGIPHARSAAFTGPDGSQVGMVTFPYDRRVYAVQRVLGKGSDMQSALTRAAVDFRSQIEGLTAPPRSGR
jgi:hypothetical protein